VTPDERTEFLRDLADSMRKWRYGYDVQPSHVLVKAIDVLLAYVTELEAAVVTLAARLEAAEQAGPGPKTEA
jgi:hypothetical protein